MVLLVLFSQQPILQCEISEIRKIQASAWKIMLFMKVFVNINSKRKHQNHEEFTHIS